MRQYKDRAIAWALGKVALNALQEATFMEEHNLKLKLMQEVHDSKTQREEGIVRLQEEELKAKIEYWKTKTWKEKSESPLCHLNNSSSGECILFA